MNNEVISNELYDIVIIGGGAAGLSAALYAARDKSNVLLIEKGFFGGQISITSEVENYPGVFETSGAGLIDTMRKQAEKFGAKFTVAEVLKIEADPDEIVRIVHTNKGAIKALSVIVASGANPRSAGFENEEQFKGRGISFCATCDGMFYQDKEVYVIGGGIAASEEAQFLTKYAKKVTMIVRRGELSAPLTIANETVSNEKIEIKFNTKLVKVEGEILPEKFYFENTETHDSYVEEHEAGSVGIFVFVGYTPESDIVKDLVEVDKYGGVITNEEMETKIKGLYVAGDVRQKSLRQLVTAASDGAIAATNAGKYTNALKREFSDKFIELMRETYGAYAE
ncbi:MAG: FAD-dependent oxidoreductase [Coriobacteriia bacterium]|nr:FAD-dependent oxidoreductase [Coriobacteriia bacterium]